MQLNEHVLLIDIGNTRAKWSFAPIGTSVADVSLAKHFGHFYHSLNAPLDLTKLSDCALSPLAVVCVNVANTSVEATLKERLLDYWPQTPWVSFKSSSNALAVQNRYESPSTLGPDRWAAILGASQANPNKNLLIVNAGTASTIDFLSSKNDYLGGWIIPGLDLMLNSLASGTAALPDLSNQHTHLNLNQLGKSTEQAILAGCLNAQVGVISMALTNNPSVDTIILSGGNAPSIESLLKKQISPSISIQIDPHLVLRGLYAWFSAQ